MPKIEIDVTDRFLEIIDAVVESEGYGDRGEFIRDAIRERLNQDVAKDDGQLFEKIKDLIGGSKGGSTGGDLSDIIGKVIGRE